MAMAAPVAAQTTAPTPIYQRYGCLDCGLVAPHSRFRRDSQGNVCCTNCGSVLVEGIEECPDAQDCAVILNSGPIAITFACANEIHAQRLKCLLDEVTSITVEVRES